MWSWERLAFGRFRYWFHKIRSPDIVIQSTIDNVNMFVPLAISWLIAIQYIQAFSLPFPRARIFPPAAIFHQYKRMDGFSFRLLSHFLLCPPAIWCSDLKYLSCSGFAPAGYRPQSHVWIQINMQLCTNRLWRGIKHSRLGSDFVCWDSSTRMGR